MCGQINKKVPRDLEELQPTYLRKVDAPKGPHRVLFLNDNLHLRDTGATREKCYEYHHNSTVTKNHHKQDSSATTTTSTIVPPRLHLTVEEVPTDFSDNKQLHGLLESYDSQFNHMELSDHHMQG